MPSNPNIPKIGEIFPALVKAKQGRDALVTDEGDRASGRTCPALAKVAQGRDTLPTNEAAPIINRAPQTLRKWACLENGPIRPVRINGRLAWRVADLRALLCGEVA